jgi:hypothetical protein
MRRVYWQITDACANTIKRISGTNTQLMILETILKKADSECRGFVLWFAQYLPVLRSASSTVFLRQFIARFLADEQDLLRKKPIQQSMMGRTSCSTQNSF